MSNLFSKTITLFVSIFLLLSITSSFYESLTYDEIVHLQEGRNAWTKHQFVIDTNNPPLVRELQVVPLLLHADKLMSVQPNMKAFPARLVTIILGALLLCFVVFTVRQYIGFTQSIIAGILFTFEPTILGNSHYVTQDIGISLFFFVSYFLLLSLLKKQKTKNLLLLSFGLGLGFASKITFIPYIFFSSIFLGLYVQKTNILRFLFKKKYTILSIFVIAFLVVWGTYFFKSNVIVVQRSDTTRTSEKLLVYAKKHHIPLLAETVNFSKTQQVPLGDYIAVLKNNILRSAGQTGSCFFLGKNVNKCSGYMMFVNAILKIPLPLIISFGIGLFVMYKKKKKEYVYYFLPILAISISALLFSMEPRVRYVLPMYPFLIIISSIGWLFWKRTIKRKVIFLLLLVWYIAGTLFSFPHFISYANELTFGQKAFLLQDSNLDWGQSLPDVRQYAGKKSSYAIRFSYFGRDNGDLYGLKSDKPYGGYKSNEICAFHALNGSANKKQITLISITNWYTCGYNTDPAFAKNRIKGIIGDSIFIF